MVDSLRIGPYCFQILPLYDGPLLWAEEGAESEPLALLLNHAVALPDSGLAKGIEDHRDAGDEIVYVIQASDASDDKTPSEAWHKQTDEQVSPESMACVGMVGHDDTLLIAWAALKLGMSELRAIRTAWRPEPGPWLFVRPARRSFVTPEDFEVAKGLEEEATAIDALDVAADVGREPPALIARRCAFLSACQTSGIFDSDHGAVREQWLGFWSCTRLLAFRQAATHLRAWGFLNDDEEALDGRVCLDYVRLALWPPGEDGAKWVHSALPLVPADDKGEQGAVLERVGGVTTMRVWWRRDGNKPALLAIAQGG